jgi:shikimate dehydrogenase
MDVAPHQLPQVIESLRAINVQGANVTVPYKEAVIAHLDQVEEGSKRLGSVNTIYKRGDRLLGTSTDGEGFLKSLGSWRKKLRGSQGLLVGAGGAAKAVAEALATSGVKSLWVANRSSKRAGQLTQTISKHHRGIKVGSVSFKEGEKLLSKSDWVIQATSLGLKSSDPSPLSLKNARRSTLIVDLIYHRETALLKEAKRLRLPHLNGIGMLLHQGALSFERWTGRRAPSEAMKRALLGRLV